MIVSKIQYKYQPTNRTDTISQLEKKSVQQYGKLAFMANLPSLERDTVEFEKNKNVSFKGIGLGMSILGGKVVYKNGTQIYKFRKIKKSIEPIWNKIVNGELQHIPNLIKLVSPKTNNTDEKLLYSLFTNDQTPIYKDMQNFILTTIFPITDDEDRETRAAKKDFVQKLYENGEYANTEFLEAFKNLPDEHYKEFKMYLCDKILYINKNKSYSPNIPECNRYDKLLLESLDKKVYSKYIDENFKEIFWLNDRINNSIIGAFKQKRNLAYIYYLENYDYNYSRNHLNPKKNKFDLNGEYWQNIAKNVIENKIRLINNPVELSKVLNLDFEFATEIIKDKEALALAKNCTSDIEANKIILNRVHEKLDKNIKVFKAKFYNDTDVKLEKKKENLRVKIKNIKDFISKSEQDISLEKLKKYQELEKEYNETVENWIKERNFKYQKYDI